MAAMTEYRQPVDSTGQPVGSKYHFCCVCTGPILGLYEQHVRSRAHTHQIWQCFNTPGHYINVALPLFTTEWPVFDFPPAEELASVPSHLGVVCDVNDFKHSCQLNRFSQRRVGQRRQIDQ